MLNKELLVPPWIAFNWFQNEIKYCTLLYFNYKLYDGLDYRNDPTTVSQILSIRVLWNID